MISVITPVAYDYKLFFESVMCHYAISDEIFVGLDVDRISWNGNKFTFNDAEFFDYVKKIDVDHKIKVIERNFHTLSKPMQNETLEKNYLSGLCKPGNWKLQIESDENMLNPNEFKQWLETKDLNCAIRGQWITVFKAFGDDLLIANDPGGKVEIGTKKVSQYTIARTTNEPSIQSPMLLLHYSWGRESKEALAEKFRNWGHAGDFDVDTYVNLWDSITLENHKEFKNLHPLDPTGWPSLSLINKSEYRSRDVKFEK